MCAQDQAEELGTRGWDERMGQGGFTELGDLSKDWREGRELAMALPGERVFPAEETA